MLQSSFQMKVNLAFYLEIKVLESGGRVERPRNQGVQHAMSSSDVGAGLSQENISFFDLLTSIMEIQFSFSSSTCQQY